MGKLRVIDCLTFAGGFTVGAVQAGFEVVAKREGPTGFGAAAALDNRHILGEGWELEACEAKDWTSVNAELLIGNPPCSGWSPRSIHVPAKGIDRKTTPVSEWTNSFRGANSAANSCMHDLVEYAARCPELQIVAFESVQQAGKQGIELMRQLRTKLETLSGKSWDLHHVFHNCLSVGGECNRPRYFWVASRIPFGVLPPSPQNPIPNAVGTLRAHEPGIDGNATPRTAEARRIASLLETGIEMAARESISEVAGRFVERYGIDSLKKLDAWDTPRLAYFVRRGFRKDPYQPIKIAGNSPMGVVSGKIQELISPTEPRCLTYREAVRALGYPESWKTSAYKNDAAIGKGIPTASGRFLASSAKLCLEGRASELVQGTQTGEREFRYDNTHAWKPSTR